MQFFSLIVLSPSNIVMALQENRTEINTSPALKKKFLQSTIDSLRNLFVFSKTLPFIGGLVVSYKFVEMAVVSTLMHYLTDSRGKNQRIAVVVTNLHDGLSSILFIFISIISEAYTGCFTVITFCAAASIEGLMLLWASTSAASADVVVYAAIFILAFVKSGQKLSIFFFEYQLQVKIKEKNEQDHTVRANIWLFAPSIVGYGITLCIAFTVDTGNYKNIFRVAAILMGGTYLLFLLGCEWYRREELTVESNLRKIFRICKAAFGKRDSMYPTSANDYYWKDCKQNYLYKHGKGLRLSPRVPRLFRWLDKAAIIEAEEVSPEKQEKNGELCTVKEVREVKSLVPMMYLCFSFFAYSLLVATGNTFFVAQAGSMTSDLTTDGNDISILFLIEGGMEYMSRFICFIMSFAFGLLRKCKAIDGRLKSKRKAATIIRICFGMVCGVICSLIAWYVEVRRLGVNKELDYDHPARNSTVALVPQFSLLGVTEGLVEGGLASLFQGHVANSMWSFEDSYSELVIGSGKLLIIPLVLIIPSWFKDSVNSSHLDRFYLMLGILNASFLLVFAYYSTRYAYKEECPEDEKIMVEQTLEHVVQSDTQDSYADNDDEALQLGDQLGEIIMIEEPNEENEENVAV